jgi:predicted nuclease with TOPRIM domain
MNLTETLKQIKGQDVESNVAEIVEQLLQLSPQQTANVVPQLSNWLKKIVDIQALEDIRSDVMNKISRLNTQRANLRKENLESEQALEVENQALLQEQGNLTSHRAGLEELKKRNAKKQAGIETLQKELDAMPKETEIKKKYEVTKKLVEEAKKNPWIASNVSERIQQIWKELPPDVIG